MKIFLLIIVLFAPCLSTLNSEAQDTRAHEHQSAAADIKRGGEYDDQNAQPWPAQILEAIRATANEYKAANEQTRAEQESLVSPKNIQLGLLVVGISYTIFACFQWRAIIATLRVNRPFLIAQQPTMKTAPVIVDGSSRDVPQCVEIDFTNFGTGPADIVDVNAFVKPFNLPPPDPKVKYPKKDRTRSHVPVIGAQQTVTLITQYFDIPSDDLRPVLNEEKRLGVYGEVRYRGGPPRKIYVTRFFWWHFPGSPKEEQFARANRETLNKRT